MSTRHTPGPWFQDQAGRIWRRDPSELYENGGGVAGDKPLAFACKGWHSEAAQGYPIEANARLIAAAPELLEAMKTAHAHIADDALRASIGNLIAKATGVQQ